MQAFINGIALAFEDTLRGMPVVLIHGFPLNRHMWRKQQEALQKAGFRVVTPDLRGFGESDATEATSISLYADDVIALLDHLKIEKAVFGGMSMGGYVLLDLLERYRERFLAACFIVTRGEADDDAGKARRLALAQEVKTQGPQVVADGFAKILFAPRTVDRNPDLVGEVYGWMAETPTLGLAGGLLAMRERKDYVSLLPSLTVPSLVIGAEEDLAIPVTHSRILAERLPYATLKVIPQGGHMVNMEQPEAFNSCLLEFLQNFQGK